MIPNVASVLTENLPLKLLALLLGLVVYAHVYTEQEHESLLRVPLTVTGLPASLVLNEPPSEFVELNTRGKGKQVLKLRMQQPEIIVDLSEVHPGRVQRMLSPTDVVLPPGTEVSITEIVEPRMVVFAVDTLVEKQAEVEVGLVSELPEGFALEGPPRAVPPRVNVRGPSTVLDQLAQARTEPIDLSRLRSSREFDLAFDRELQGLEFQPAAVRVSVRVVELATRELSLAPIRLLGLAPELAARVEPDTAWVTLTGPGPLLEHLDLTLLRVVLDASGLDPGRHLLAPDVQLPDRAGLRLQSVRPARFMVEIGARSR
jgi:YbbR domain-containing protein